MNFEGKTIDELSLFYELSLASCHSIDIKENAVFFEKALMERFDLSSIAYLKKIDTQALCFSIPEKLWKKGAQLTIEILESFMHKENAKILNEEEIEMISHAFSQTAKFQMCYLLGDKNILILGRDVQFDEMELNTLQKIIIQFGRFMNGLLLKEEYKLENLLRVKTEVELTEKNAELSRCIRSNLHLQKHARFVSHELKAPSRNISSYASLLHEKIQDKISEDEVKLLNIIQERSEHMNVLIDNILLYSKIESSRLNLEKIKFKDLVNTVLIQLSYIIDSTNSVVNLNFGEEEILADKDKIHKVVQNIIQNSLVFAPSNRPTIIDVDLKEIDKDVIISISDNGNGVDPIYHLKVFELMKKMETSKNGTGVGLSLCKMIIEKHQGKIWMVPNEGQGTKLVFNLPKI